MRARYPIGRKIEFRDVLHDVVQVRLAEDKEGHCLVYTLSNGDLVSFERDGHVYEVYDFKINISLGVIK